MEEKSTKVVFGLKPNVAGLLCYLGMYVTGILFLIFEKENKFVRFHALQSILLFVPFELANIVLGFIPLLGGLVAGVLDLVRVALWLFLMYKAFMGEDYKLPVVGEAAWNQINKAD